MKVASLLLTTSAFVEICARRVSAFCGACDKRRTREVATMTLMMPVFVIFVPVDFSTACAT